MGKTSQRKYYMTDLVRIWCVKSMMKPVCTMELKVWQHLIWVNIHVVWHKSCMYTPNFTYCPHSFSICTSPVWNVFFYMDYEINSCMNLYQMTAEGSCMLLPLIQASFFLIYLQVHCTCITMWLWMKESLP